MKQPNEYTYIFLVVSRLLGSSVFGSFVLSVLCTLCTKYNIIPLARLRTTQFRFSESNDFFGSYTFFKKKKNHFSFSSFRQCGVFVLPFVTGSEPLLNYYYWLSCICVFKFFFNFYDFIFISFCILSPKKLSTQQTTI